MAVKQHFTEQEQIVISYPRLAKEKSNGRVAVDC